jgi:hypothetical protein
MINSIPKIDSNSNNTFGRVSQKTNPSDFWLEEKTKKQKSEYEQMKDSIKILTPDEARKTHNPKIIGLSIAGATIVTAGGLLLFLKGGPKGFGKNFRKLRNYLDTKIQMGKLNDGVLSTTNKAYVVAVNKMDRLLRKGEAVNNFTTFKDSLFERIMGCNKVTRKLHSLITKWFEQLGIHSVLNNYGKTQNKLSDAIRIASGSVKKTPENEAMVERINSLTGEIETLSDKNFGQRALRSRYYLFKKVTQEMKMAFNKLNVFWTKDVFKQFLADSKIMHQRENIAKNVLNARRGLSYSRTHLAKDSDDIIMKMVENVNIKDTEQLTLLRNIRAGIRKFTKKSKDIPENELKKQIVSDIEKFTQTVNTKWFEQTIDNQTATKLLSEISDLKSLLTTYKSGKVEELLGIYKQLLSPKDFKKVEKAYTSWVNSLDKSIKIETEDFVNKLRDLTMGSAPTDILSLLGGLGVLGYNLGKADNNDQRISISLKYGIPALSLIGVSLYCNAKLFAGTKALVFATVASSILNRIGSYADNTLKKYSAKKEYAENPPKTV